MRDTPCPEPAEHVLRLFRDYQDAVSAKNAEAWGECWHSDDAEWLLEMGGGPQCVTGKAEIVGRWTDRMTEFAHVAITHEITGCSAPEADVVLVESITREEQTRHDGSMIVATGRYSDRIVRTEGRWRFASRSFVLENRKAA